MQLSEKLQDEILEFMADWSIRHGLAKANTEGHGIHSPLSFFPAPITASAFENGQKAAVGYSKLITAISQDKTFITETLAETARGDPFVAKLIDMMNTTETKAVPVNKIRTDFFYSNNNGDELSLVEVNTVSAGMQPFGTRTYELHQALRKRFPILEKLAPGPLAVNNGLYEIGKLYDRAADDYMKKMDFPAETPKIILFIVQNSEPNRFDQRMTEDSILDGIVIRRTMTQLSTQLFSEDNKLYINLEEDGFTSKTPVSFVYFRAGYIPEDYPTETEWNVRRMIELSEVPVNPTVAVQLSGMKTMQMKLCEEGVLERFISKEDAEIIRPTMTQMWPMNDETVAMFRANPNNFVLKSQGEGGGHCLFGEEIEEWIPKFDEATRKSMAFMKWIKPAIAQPTVFIHHGHRRIVEDPVTEFGFFTLSYQNHHEYIGNLNRTKSAQTNEGGISVGAAVSDAVRLL